MGRIENNSKKKRYLYIIGGLVLIIVGLIGFIVGEVYSNKSEDKASISSTEILTSSSAIISSNSSTSQPSTEETTSSSVKNNEEDPASEAVKNLSTEQRAALIILGAPSGWNFNGYPSKETWNKSMREIALSPDNRIELSVVDHKLGDNTSASDQIFHVFGNDVQGVGGIIAVTYAFGRDGDKIYYYKVTVNYDQTPVTTTTTSLGVSNINAIWKAYYDVGDLSTMNTIANNIVIK